MFLELIYARFQCAVLLLFLCNLLLNFQKLHQQILLTTLFLFGTLRLFVLQTRFLWSTGSGPFRWSVDWSPRTVPFTMSRSRIIGSSLSRFFRLYLPWSVGATRIGCGTRTRGARTETASFRLWANGATVRRGFSNNTGPSCGMQATRRWNQERAAARGRLLQSGWRWRTAAVSAVPNHWPDFGRWRWRRWWRCWLSSNRPLHFNRIMKNLLRWSDISKGGCWQKRSSFVDFYLIMWVIGIRIHIIETVRRWSCLSWPT